MIVGVAWITAWQARNCSNRHRVLPSRDGIRILFYFLLDEHLTIHEDNTNWLYLYIALGIALTAATLLSARARSLARSHLAYMSARWSELERVWRYDHRQAGDNLRDARVSAPQWLPVIGPGGRKPLNS